MINHCRRQPYFLYRTFIWIRVLAWCMSRLISFARASSSCKEQDLQNEKLFLPTAGFKLTTPGFWGQRRNHQAMRPAYYYHVKSLRDFSCATYVFILTRSRVFVVYICIQYCSHTTYVLFCSLTNNHTSILVNRLNNPVFLLPLLICRWQRLLKNRVTSLTLYLAIKTYFMYLVTLRLCRFYTQVVQPFNYYNFISNIPSNFQSNQF